MLCEHLLRRRPARAAPVGAPIGLWHAAARSTNQIVKNPEFITALNEAMRQFSVDHNVDAVINVLKNRYDQL